MLAIDPFSSNVTSNVSDKFKLAHVDSELKLAEVGPGDYSSLSKNTDVMSRLEKVIETWTKQIEQVRYHPLNEAKTFHIL